MVKRYVVTSDEAGPDIEEHNAGALVMFDDYATLESELAKAKAERDAHESMAGDIDEALKDAEAENAKLRDLLRRVLDLSCGSFTWKEVDERLMEIAPDVAKAIEPSGEPGDVEGE